MTRDAGRGLARRWLRFHLSIGGTAALNLLVFGVARLALPALAASALGIGVAAVFNYLLADRLVFRPAHGREVVAGRFGGSRYPLLQARRQAEVA